MDAVAKDAIRALAAKNRPRGAVNSVMQLVDWHSNRHLPLPLFVVEAFALALGLDAYLRELEAVALHARGVQRDQIVMQIGRSRSTVDRWRAKRSYRRRLAAARERIATIAFDRFAIDTWSGREEAVNEVKEILRRGGEYGDPRRGDGYPSGRRQRLLDIVIWFSARNECLPDAVWFACACALGLATYNGGLRISFGRGHHPEKYHNAVILDADWTLEKWNTQVANGTLTPTGIFPAMEELDFSPTSWLANQVGIDRKTLSRWRESAAYKLARFVNIISIRRDSDGRIAISKDERDLMHKLVAEAQREYDQQTRSGLTSAPRPPRLTSNRTGVRPSEPCANG